MISIGDEMDYHLIRPNYAAGQNYKFTQEHTYKNFTSTNSCKKRIEKLKGLTKTVPLSNGTLYIHTAHDDEMFYHCLDYVKQIIKTNRVRLVLVFRWLSASTYFRQSTQDDRSNRYSTVDKHAFEDMHLRKKGHVWWNAMGYIRPDGTNVITSLMDPINEKEDEEKGTKKTAKKIFRTENNKKRKSN